MAEALRHKSILDGFLQKAPHKQGTGSDLCRVKVPLESFLYNCLLWCWICF